MTSIDINYWMAVPLLLLVIALLAWLIKRNQKDKKKVEKEIMQSELKPEKHDEKKINNP